VTAPVASGRVLATLNADGSRRWIRPMPSRGTHWKQRRVVAYALIVLYLAIPHLRLHGKPLMLLDLPRREFTLFGTTFLPTDTLLLMLLGVSILLFIFLLTALFGRVWCGWACPQTVWMEFVFRPIERLLEGGWAGSRQLDKQGKHFHSGRVVKYAIYGVLAVVLANTFLAYFVGTETLARWVQQSPNEHPAPFLVMAVTTALVFLDFTWFREQTCLVACPYGRWQSVLLDKQSLIVAYDAGRGEPRGKPRHNTAGTTTGDCVDCNACVSTCPTGIDIRDGLQMECIHCTQCADACNTVMRRVGKPEGLIRYTSRELLEGKIRHVIRPRTVIYPAAFLLFFGAFIYALVTKPTADITLLGEVGGTPFTRQADGTVVNQLRVKIANRAPESRIFAVTLIDAPEAHVIAPELPITIRTGANATISMFIVVPASAFHDGEHRIRMVISDGLQFHAERSWRLVGPSERRHEQEERR
jgi:cytochrome c oxidase accessory protein FixG